MKRAIFEILAISFKLATIIRASAYDEEEKVVQLQLIPVTPSQHQFVESTFSEMMSNPQIVRSFKKMTIEVSVDETGQPVGVSQHQFEMTFRPNTTQKGPRSSEKQKKSAGIPSDFPSKLNDLLQDFRPEESKAKTKTPKETQQANKQSSQNHSHKEEVRRDKKYDSQVYKEWEASVKDVKGRVADLKKFEFPDMEMSMADFRSSKRNYSRKRKNKSRQRGRDNDTWVRNPETDIRLVD